MTNNTQREAFEIAWPAIDSQPWPTEPKEFAFQVWQAALAHRDASAVEVVRELRDILLSLGKHCSGGKIVGISWKNDEVNKGIAEAEQWFKKAGE